MAGKRNVLVSVREDDFVEYFLFPQIENGSEKEQEVAMARVLKEANNVIQKYTSEYLWHKDEFKLVPRTAGLRSALIQDDDTEEYLPAHLHGVSHFGDNIEDEWFMVFLLHQLTKEIQGSIARVFDADGEFLLIEAADYLPAWATPDNCDKRVYIFDGNLHIIPCQPSDDQEDESVEQITVPQAISRVRNNPRETVASADVQNALKSKLQGYPEKIKDGFHRATAYLPVGVAAILKHKRSLIASAVQAFCNRDPVDLRACKAMKYFPPENRVNSTVTFTKCLYAMLMHSKYVPDRRTGWNLPQSSSPQFRAHDLGIKIASGFEILAAQAKPSGDIDQDKGWHNYLKSLHNKNYFNGFIEHSRDYNNLLNKAKEYYINHRDSMQYAPAVGQEILDLTKSLNYQADELKREEKSLPPDDDDSWLTVTPEQVDQMLREKYGQADFATINNNSDAASFTEKVSTFLNHVSGLDGAEFPSVENTQSPARPPRGVKKNTKVSFATETKVEDKAKNRVSLDPDGFCCAVESFLNFVIPEDDNWDLESGSDMSDYGEDNCVNEESYEEARSKMKQYMEEMDKELAATTIGESFEKQTDDCLDDVEDFKPVDVDVNALKNILESYRLQFGEAGPSSNMLGPMGLTLDPSSKDVN